MKRKIYLSLISGILVIGLTTGCGDSQTVNSKQTIVVDENEFSYKVDAPYYGNITIGEGTINMLSTTEMLSDAGMTWNTMTAYGYKEKQTKDKFNYEKITDDNYYEVEFLTYNSTYEDNGCYNCDDHMSKNVVLPKDVTYDSTVDEVISKYGEPSTNEETEDNMYMYNNNLDGERFGTLDATRLVYKYEQENVELKLELYFAKNSGKLYRIQYTMRVEK